MDKIILKSLITCPQCEHKEFELMSTDACQYFYDCKGCGTLLKPRSGDCCVFCSYGSFKCPSMQIVSYWTELSCFYVYPYKRTVGNINIFWSSFKASFLIIVGGKIMNWKVKQIPSTLFNDIYNSFNLSYFRFDWCFLNRHLDYGNSNIHYRT